MTSVGEGTCVYRLEGLDCADCADKIERAFRKVPGMSDSVVSFATQTVSLHPSFEEEARNILLATHPEISLVRQKPGRREVQKPKEWKGKLASITLAAVLTLVAVISQDRLKVLGGPWLAVLPFLPPYVLVGWNVISDAVRGLTRRSLLDENFLMTLSTVGAFAIGQYTEAVAVMLFFSVGEFFQDMAVAKSRSSISALMDLRPEVAHVVTDDSVVEVDPTTVLPGTIVQVRPGERIPLDGIVEQGASFIDTSSLTGESVPRSIDIGGDVMAGSINGSGLLHIRVTREFAQSSISRILELVESAASRKAPTEQLITKLARVYTPLVVAGAALIAILPPLLIHGETFREWIYRALVLMVISCPCALVLSIPLSYFAGLGGMSRLGVLVKGSNILEGLANLRTVVFDKTGTLTKGVFNVVNVSSANGYTSQEILELAAKVEAYSSHPIAKSIREAVSPAVTDQIATVDSTEIRGQGVVSYLNGLRVAVGNSRLMVQELGQQAWDKAAVVTQTGVTEVYVAVNGIYSGTITISDEVKEGSGQAIHNLASVGIESVGMLTGDREVSASKVAESLGLSWYAANLLPEDKVAKIEQVPGPVAFVGDGINDAPVLMRADIGVAMGGLGSDAAIEAADVVVMDDDVRRIAQAIAHARFTRRIVVENILLTATIKGVFLVMGAFGIATVWEAVIGDVGVALVAVLNATRALKR